MPAHTMQQEIKIPAIRQHRGGERQRPKKKKIERENKPFSNKHTIGRAYSGFRNCGKMQT